MSIVRPFRGLRFDLDRVGADALSLCAPASDAIAPDRLGILAGRERRNAIHLEGPDGERTAREWISRGFLVRDPRPAFYVYRQAFTATVAGLDDRFSRTSVVGLVDPSTLAGPVAPSDGRSRPEAALPVAVHDRSDLDLRGICDAAPPAAMRFLDDDSVEHSLQVLDDPGMVAALQEILGSIRAVVIDGSVPRGRAETMAMLVAADSSGLLLKPVHHICRGVPADGFGALVAGLAARHRVEEFPYLGADAADSLLDTLPEDVLGFVLRQRGADRVRLVQIHADAARRQALDAEILRRELQSEFPAAQLVPQSEGHGAMELLDADPDASFAAFSRPVRAKSVLDLAESGKNWDPSLAPLHPRPWRGLIFHLDD